MTSPPKQSLEDAELDAMKAQLRGWSDRFVELLASAAAAGGSPRDARSLRVEELRTRHATTQRRLYEYTATKLADRRWVTFRAATAADMLAIEQGFRDLDAPPRPPAPRPTRKGTRSRPAGA